VESWEQDVADTIAREGIGCVRGILVEGDFGLSGDLEEVRFTEGEEGTKDLDGRTVHAQVGDGAHGSESSRGGASEEAEENGFGLVVGMMSESDVGRAAFQGGFAEELEAFATACAFEGFVVLEGALANVDGARDEGNGEARAEGSERCEIGVQFIDGAQAMIEMRCDERICDGGAEQVEEHGGVDAT
jgi:hypothetical protein